MIVFLGILAAAPAHAQEPPPTGGGSTGDSSRQEDTPPDTSPDTPPDEPEDEAADKGPDSALPTSHPSSTMVDPTGNAGPATNRPLDSSVTLVSRGESQFGAASIGGRTDDFLWQIGVNAPVRQSGNVAPPDLDGLSDSTTLSLSMTYLFWNPRADLEAFTAVCADATVEEYVCDPEHPSTEAVKNELLAAQRAVCEAAMACTIQSIPSAEGQLAFTEASDLVYEQARNLLCEEQKKAAVEGSAGCSRADAAKAGNDMARRYDQARTREARDEICREAATQAFTCNEPANEALEAKARELGLEAARVQVCRQYQPCTRAALPDDAARQRWDEAKYAVCERDMADIRKRPKQRAGMCTRKQLAARARRYRESNAANAQEKAARYAELVRRLDSAVTFDRAYTLGLRLRAARERFAYMLPATLDTASQLGYMGSAGASVGMVLSGFGSITGSYEFQQDYLVATKAMVCKPIDATGTATRCQTLPFGQPSRQRNHIVRLELRHFFSANLGAAVRASYEISDKVFGVEVPIFFLKDKSGGLAGGVALGYRSDTKDPSAGIFLSQRLTLLP